MSLKLDVMKLLVCLLSLSLAYHTLAEVEPNELTILREQWKSSQKLSLDEINRKYQHDKWEASRERAIKEANKIYEKNLEDMRNKFMKQLNWEAAVAVNQEMEKLAKNSLIQKFLEGPWIGSYEGHKKSYTNPRKTLMVFTKDKVINNLGIVGKWHYEDGIITATWGLVSYQFEIDIKKNPNIINGVSSDEYVAKTVWIRYEPKE